ncbi:protein turtle homolog A-like [Oncorhynchus nerka]|uniref:protein turtle homolog A-like n=1 Tax=Oncorhynchus nerka TaxID=8023 RepID=UPI0031B82F94
MGPKKGYFVDVTMVTALCLLCVSHGQKPEVRAKEGGVVEMECRLPPTDPGASVSLHVVEWVRQGFEIPVLIKFGVYAPRVHPNYEDRCYFPEVVSCVRALLSPPLCGLSAVLLPTHLDTLP